MMGFVRVEHFTEAHGRQQRSVTRIYGADGNVAATMSSTRSASKSGTPKKHAPYSYKQLSGQLMRAKTSGSVSRVLTKMRNKRMQLIGEKRKGDCDETEIALAIIHAEAIERVAKKRKKNLQMEEQAKAEQESEEYEEQLEEAADPLGLIGGDSEDGPSLSDEDMERMLDDIEDELKELMDEMEENAKLDESLKEMTGALSGDMEPEDLEALKKKHRSDEQRDIIRADMKYLKALFDKLSRDKENAAAGSSSSPSPAAVYTAPAPATAAATPPATADIPAAPEGGSIDVSV